jgi:hypothetical protein
MENPKSAILYDPSLIKILAILKSLCKTLFECKYYNPLYVWYKIM